MDSPGLLSRASKYIAKMPAAISGESGSNAAFSVAMTLVEGFGLDKHQALEVIKAEFNHRCVPPWSDYELEHKIDDAIKRINPEKLGHIINGKACGNYRWNYSPYIWIKSEVLKETYADELRY